MLTDQVPYVISISFLIALCIAVFMIAGLAKKAHRIKTYYYILGFYVIYLVLVAVACFQGFLDANTLPPKIIMVTTLPLLIFYLAFIFNTAFYKDILQKVPLADWIRLHIFRLIGGFFLILFLLGQLPKSFAFIAGFGDMITAISSLFVAKAIQNKYKNAKTIALFWNTFGLLDIIMTSATAVYLTKLNIETGTMGVGILTKFPFCFIPAFAPATIIFLHVSIYRKLFFKKFQ